MFKAAFRKYREDDYTAFKDEATEQLEKFEKEIKKLSQKT